MADEILMANIKALRESKKWTQQEMADKLLISKSSISKWEKGKQNPDMQYVKKYCEIFECTLDEITEDDELPFKSKSEREVKTIIKEVVVEQPKVVNTEILYRGSVSFNNTIVKAKKESIWKMSVAQIICIVVWTVLILSMLIYVIVTDEELHGYGAFTNILSTIIMYLMFAAPVYIVFVLFRLFTIKSVPVYTPNGDCEINNNGILVISQGNKKEFPWSEVVSFTNPEQSRDKSIYFVEIKLKNSNHIVIAHTDLFDVIKPAKYFSIWKNNF